MPFSTSCSIGFSYTSTFGFIPLARLCLLLCLFLTITSPGKAQCNATSPWLGSYGVWSGPGAGGGNLNPAQFNSGGIFKIPTSYLVLNNPDHLLFRTSFHFRDTVCITDNFSFEARVKNPDSEGGRDAYDTRIEILGSGMNAGCNLMGAAWAQSYNSAWVGGTSTNNQAGLVVDLNDWAVIKMEFNNGVLHYSRDDEEFFQLPYSGNICNIYGFNFTFKGSGSIDWVKLTDGYGNVVYFEDFLDCNNFSLFPECEAPVLNTSFTPPNCIDNNLYLNVSNSSSQPLQYQWSGPNGFSSNDQNPVIPNPAEGTYTVTASSNYCNPSAQESLVVTFPVSYLINAIRYATVCSGGSYMLPGGEIVSNSGTYTDTTASSVPWCRHINTTQLSLSNASVQVSNDATICQGSSTTLSASGGLTYSWSPATGLSDPNISNPVATPTQTTSYVVTAQLSVGSNLVVNGDFEAGNTGFNSGYVFSGPSGFNQGNYGIGTNPNNYNSGFDVCGDHSSGSGNMLIVDAACGTFGIPVGTQLWCQTISVTPHTDYAFSTWMTNLYPTGSPSTLQFSINGNPIGLPVNTSPQGCEWNEFYVIWNSGTSTSATICISEGSGQCGGNDFAIDDISFAALCYSYDTVVVEVIPPPVITLTGPSAICEGEQAQFTASSSTANLSYNWSPGGNTGSTLSVSPTSTTTYSVTAQTPEGCVSNTASTTLTVNAIPLISIQYEDTLCSGEQAVLTASSNVTGTTYSWSPGGSTSNPLVVTPSASTQYVVTATTAGNCSTRDTAYVTVIPPLSVTISGNTEICEGEYTILTASGNVPGMSYSWSPSGNTGPGLTVLFPQAGTHTVSASYHNCPVATASVTVVAAEVPVVSVPDDFLICPGEEVEATVSSSIPGSTLVWLPFNLNGTSNTLAPLTSTYVYVYAENGHCVSAIDSFYIAVSDACFIVVPNVFSPNGDGVNDHFSLVDYMGIKSLNCSIMNRWGVEIKTFDRPDFRWDGTDKDGKKVPEGTYFYVIKAQTAGGEPIEKQGHVNLHR